MKTDAFLNKIKEYYPGEDFDFSKIEEAVLKGDGKHGLFDIDSLLVFRPDMATLLTVILSPVYEREEIDEEFVLNLGGAETLTLLEGLKKLHDLNYEENDRRAQIDILRKMFLTMARDIRVILIALSQRLYLMGNLEENEKNIARETLDLYVPIAGRLGVYRMKTRLEDLSFKYVQEKDHDEINSALEVFGENGKSTIDSLTEQLNDFLTKQGVNTEISGRVKSVYSIYRKLIRKNYNSIRDLHDIFAIRIILDHGKDLDSKEDIEHLYKILGMIHGEWSPLAKRFKDYVAMPKQNGYKSLHTVVSGLIGDQSDQAVEIQIRTKSMHLEAEYGMASHWLYKKAGKAQSQAAWLRGLKKINMNMGQNLDVMKEVELDVFKDRIFVLTPRGEVKNLALGSTPIDFAYSVHSDLGNMTYMAKVNDKVVPLSSELKNGDVVQITTRVDSQPKLEWLSFVHSSNARTCIKAWFNKENAGKHLKDGKKMVNKYLEKVGKEALDQNYSVLKNYFGQNLTIAERESLLQEVGKGGKMAADIMKRVFPELLKKRRRKKKVVKLVEGGSKILIGGEQGLPIKIAKCCSPKSGNDILAYITRGNSVTVHKAGCKLLKFLESDRFISASWKA